MFKFHENNIVLQEVKWTKTITDMWIIIICFWYAVKEILIYITDKKQKTRNKTTTKYLKKER